MFDSLIGSRAHDLVGGDYALAAADVFFFQKDDRVFDMHQSWFGNSRVGAEAPLMVVGDGSKNA